MQLTTIERLQCPKIGCKGSLDLNSKSGFEHLVCKKCKKHYPVLAGIPILVPDPDAYLLFHVKGVSRYVTDQQIPAAIRKSYVKAKKEIVSEHIEEDLESDRVNALYFMNHYLSAKEAMVGVESPEIKDLIQKYWDHGPQNIVQTWVEACSSKAGKLKVVELGCGVGGLARMLADSCSDYLGVDSSFASIALARSIYFSENKSIKEQGIPSDLIQGALPRSIMLTDIRSRSRHPLNLDFIVGDLQALPLKPKQFDGSIVLNAIDMMDDPSALPKIQSQLIHDQGFAIQSAPYVWHERIAAKLRKRSIGPADKKLTSSQLVSELYDRNNLKIEDERQHVPWVFFKHLRQVELYSVHAFLAKF